MCWFYEVLGIGYYLPVAECDLNITSKIDYGIINGMAFFGILLSYHLLGFLADTKGRRKVLIPTLLVSLIFTVLSSLTKSFWLFAVFRFFNGFL
jgi:VNT family MFS transporter (synaptic vesicle glycoprotein 2)